MRVIRLRILGEAAIEVGETTILPSATHLFALLLYICIERDTPIQREALFDLLFPGAATGVAAHNLRQLLYRLRRYGVPMRTNASMISVDPDAVEDPIEHALTPTSYVPPGSGIARYTLLPNYTPPTSPLSHWLEAYRERVQRQLVRKLGADLTVARRNAAWHSVESLSRILLSQDPYNETATLCLAEALARTGSKHKALSLLQSFEEDTGRLDHALTLPSRLLQKRIAEHSQSNVGAISEAPVLGRSTEMAHLADIWGRASRGRLTTALIAGEASVGKSRLVSEFLSLVRLDCSGAFLASRRVASDRLRPFSLVADISKHLLSMPGAAGCSPESIALLLRLTAPPPRLSTAEHTPTLFDTSVLALYKASLELVAAVASERPLIIAVDDVQYLDDESRNLITWLTENGSGVPLLLLLSGSLPDGVIPASTFLRLPPLPREAMCELATSIVARSGFSMDADSVSWCLAMSAGNPGHLELLLSSVATSQSPLRVPADLIALTDERIAACTPSARHALLALAIFDITCGHTDVESITGLRAYDLLCAVEELEHASLVEATLAGLRCRSDLIQERVLRRSAASVVALIHSRIAERLELSCDSSFTQSIAWRIAAHWQAAGCSAKARDWQRMCWRHTIAIGQPMAAVSSIRPLLEEAATPADRALLLDELANALSAADENAARVLVLKERVVLSTQCGDAECVRQALEYDLVEASLRNYDEERPFVERLRFLVSSPQLDPSRRIRAARSLMIIAHNELDPQLAREVHELNCAISCSDRPSLLLQGHGRLIYHSVFGDRDEALREAGMLRSVALEGGHSWQTYSTLLNISLARLIVDSDRPDLADLVMVYERSREAGMVTHALFCASRIACILLELGPAEEAVHWGGISRKLHEGLDSDRRPMDFLSSQTNLALLSGDFKAAEVWIDSMPRSSPRLASGLNAHTLFLYQLKHRMFCRQQSPSLTEIERLLSWHERARAFGRHDEHMELMWFALCSVGRALEASALLARYVQEFRRERRSITASLSMRTAADPFWQTYSH